jgi:hypothetical protein
MAQVIAESSVSLPDQSACTRRGVSLWYSTASTVCVSVFDMLSRHLSQWWTGASSPQTLKADW